MVLEKKDLYALVDLNFFGIMTLLRVCQQMFIELFNIPSAI